MKLVDAQEMHRKHPDTFGVPSDAELDTIGVGSTIKVCDGMERFWCEVRSVVDGALVCRVDNDLFGDDLALGDAIIVRRENVYDIYEERG